MQDDRVVTIERTGKKWKKIRVLAWLLLILGGILIAGAERTPGGPGGPAAVAGIVAIVSSIGLWIYSRVGAWWSHG